MRVGGRLEGRRSEVAGALLEEERRKCQCIGAHKHGGKAMPNKGRLWCADEWINRGCEGDKAACRTS